MHACTVNDICHVAECVVRDIKIKLISGPVLNPAHRWKITSNATDFPCIADRK